jgi:hypothetical protein
MEDYHDSCGMSKWTRAGFAAHGQLTANPAQVIFGRNRTGHVVLRVQRKRTLIPQELFSEACTIGPRYPKIPE